MSTTIGEKSEEKDRYNGKEVNRINRINRINRKKREHDAKRAVQKAIEARASFLISIMELLSPLTTKLLHMLHKTNYSWAEASLLGHVFEKPLLTRKYRRFSP